MLSRRMLVFTAKEVLFYCPRGVLFESVSLGDDQCEPLPSRDVSSIELCELLHTSRTHQRSSNISASVKYYESVYLKLLNFYGRRVLSYDNDVLNAFSGVINAQLGILGRFYWGLPQRLFARALLLSRTASSDYTMSRRPGFPSWSWVGWKPDKPGQLGPFNNDVLSSFFPIAYIYKHDERSSLELLMGFRDDQGIEGCCADSIDRYNSSTKLDPLPKWPCIEKVPKLPQLFGQESLPVLVFWTHVARFVTNAIKSTVMFFRMDECRDWRARTHIEFVLIGTSEPFPNYPVVHGILIERHLGYARRIGTALNVPLYRWLAGDPKKELILLI
jgi:hypothetical protein